MKLRSPHIKHLQESIMQEFILEGTVMRSIMKVVHEVARYDVNVLITGESGTGKELLAKIIHLQSPRAEYPFVPVNCGILSGVMFEDKLFGHEKGAFTGAIRREKGCFEIADKGTLFLDEVFEIPIENQADFLRVLEDFRFARIGGNQLIEVDVRIVSATNNDLKEKVKQGLFREDLFYRLHVVPLYIPPLRERRAVIPKMVDSFMNQLAANHKKPRPSVTPEVMEMFCRYDWPGNVRELKNLLERVIILNNDDVIDVEHLPSDFVWHFIAPLRTMDLEGIRRSAETKAILDVLYRVTGDKDQAAKILGISPRTLRYKLKRYNLKVDRKGNPISLGTGTK
ncbi:MAG: sigma-54 dependent transcriptional regulator [Deltaproteobacteria bacterium]|nr:sigma-54 dependent transcriptional regulator [Deltaproteobacteria bacterium]